MWGSERLQWGDWLSYRLWCQARERRWGVLGPLSPQLPHNGGNQGLLAGLHATHELGHHLGLLDAQLAHHCGHQLCSVMSLGSHHLLLPCCCHSMQCLQNASHSSGGGNISLGL